MLDMKALTISTLHTTFDGLPWVRSGAPGIEFRIVQARPSESLIVTQFRAQPGAKSGLHRHTGLVLGITTRGAWGHHPERFPYQVGSYISEPTGEPHCFYNGPEVSEATYVEIGCQENLDPVSGEVVSRSDHQASLDKYLAACQALGLARPPVLS
jgi:quercetin dioxygenase-like cupin family protein